MLAGSVKIENVSLMLNLPSTVCRDCLVFKNKLTGFVRQSFGDEFGRGVVTVECDDEIKVRGCINGKIFELTEEKVVCSP
ncbi:MAG: hypothetical protein WC503_04875 [Candidatus Shapirobacteria bacterium]